MINFKLRNFRGAKIADFAHEKITLIGGENGSGKSSICQATASVLTGEPPIEDLLKAHYKLLRHNGADIASITAKTESGEAMSQWGNGEYTSSGEFKNISTFAAGLDKITNYKKSLRAEKISRFIDIEPTTEEFKNELKALDINDKTIEAMLKSIKLSGWEATHKLAKEQVSRKKGAWEEVTSERYGSKKAEQYFPEDYYAALETLDRNKLIEDLKSEEENLKNLSALKIYSKIEKAELKEKADNIPILKTQEKSVKGALDKCLENEIELRQNIAEIKNQIDNISHGCPHCGGLLSINNDKIEAFTGLEDEERSSAENVLKQLNSNLKKLLSDIADGREALTTAQGKMAEALNAERELKKLPEKNESTKDLDVKIKKAEITISDLTNNLKAIEIKERADSLHKSIVTGTVIIKALAPTGLRQTKLNEVLRDLNKRLEVLTNFPTFGEVRIFPDFDIMYDNKPLNLCSRSEVYKAEVALQILFAEQDKSEIILVDDADNVVGKEGRNSFFGMLLKSQATPIIFMARSKHNEIVDLKKIGGTTYLIENGILKEV